MVTNRKFARLLASIRRPNAFQSLASRFSRKIVRGISKWHQVIAKRTLEFYGRFKTFQRTLKNRPDLCGAPDFAELCTASRSFDRLQGVLDPKFARPKSIRFSTKSGLCEVCRRFSPPITLRGLVGSHWRTNQTDRQLSRSNSVLFSLRSLR